MNSIAGVASFDGKPDVSQQCRSLLQIQDRHDASEGVIGSDRFPAMVGPAERSKIFSEEGLIVIADCLLYGGTSRDPHSLSQIRNVYRKHGAPGLDQLRGIFAIVIIDLVSRQIILTRDISGSKPLFWSRLGGVLAFASMPGSLAKLFGLDPDTQSLASYLVGRGATPTASYWREIHNIEPGTTEVHHAAKRLRLHHSRPVQSISNPKSWDDLSYQLREKLDKAVAFNLQDSGRPVAAQLSSGFDSNAVVASAAAQIAEEGGLRCLTATPNPKLATLVDRHRIPDEGALATRAAASYGAMHDLIPDTSRIVSSIRGMARYFHGPVANPINHGWGLGLGRAAAGTGASIMLRATHGNASISFGGLPVLAELVRTNRWRSWFREVRAIDRSGIARLRGVLVNSFGPWVPSPLLDQLYSLAQGRPPHEDGAFIRPEAMPEKGNERTSHSLFEERMVMILNYDPGAWDYGFKSLTGIEHRDPTGDRDLVDFCMALPPEALLRDGRIKPLFRDSMKGRIPDFILDAPKRGFQGADFYGRISSDECNEAIEEFSSCSAASDLIDMKRLRVAVNAWPKYDPKHFGALFSHVRHVSNALSVGLFLSEVENYPVG